MKRQHGERNRDLCDKLLSDGIYLDWVITTAFYSAIHLIDHKLFPLIHKNHELNNIDEAKQILGGISKHQVREILVGLYLPAQAVNYSYLKKNCWTARYLRYQTTVKQAKISRQRLEQIINACLSPSASSSSMKSQ